MKINTDSLHYKLYSLTYTGWGNRPPVQTNLCQYVRRITLIAFLQALVLLGAGIFLILMLPIMILRSIGAFLFGYKTDLHDGTLYRYHGLSIKGFEIYPGYLLAPIALGIGNYFLIRHWPTPYATVIIGTEIVFGVSALLVGAIVFSTSDTFWLVREYVDAKTQGVCPLVEFEEKK